MSFFRKKNPLQNVTMVRTKKIISYVNDIILRLWEWFLLLTS